MLAKNNRLTKKKDFDAVFTKGKSVKQGFLLVKMAPNALPENRYGFVISKKVSPKATVRNKLKRQLRTIVAALPAPSQNSQDFVFIVLPGLQKEPFTLLEGLVANIFKKIK